MSNEITPLRETKKKTGARHPRKGPKQQRRKKQLTHKNTQAKKQPAILAKKKQYLLFMWHTLFYLLMIAMLVSAGALAIMQKQDQALNGYRMFGVLTNSMVSPDNHLKAGGFRAGDILVIHETPAEQIKVGDVITYRPSTNPTNKNNNYLTHRVVEILDQLGEEKGRYFITRGDANQTNDLPIHASALVGKGIFRIPKLGGILLFIKENWLLSGVCFVSILGFIWVMRMYILTDQPPTSTRKQRPRQKRRPKNAPSKNDIALKPKVNINKKTHNRRKQK